MQQRTDPGLSALRSNAGFAYPRSTSIASQYRLNFYRIYIYFGNYKQTHHHTFIILLSIALKICNWNVFQLSLYNDGINLFISNCRHAIVHIAFTADRAQSDEQKKSSPTSVSIDKSSNTTQDKINSDKTSTVATANSAVTATLANHEAPENEVTTGLNGQAEAIAGTTPVKICLSRHNSTHTSIKKKVNISSHAEIIEPDPLPPPPYDPIALAVDDDDVFSDSLPPPKRESMCAPYIEPSEVPETAAYAHGLPEWFNDERINDIICLCI
ncbi:uncharacterized protein LOC118752778 [Rhagoletis pomonella]|uniref:uncharacterized protein LOC118752778 n=1 Tax=Rhagoletis pomonella TaxID=28610 RepID=UPI00177BD6F3|nr:uncharacterized protein LOC118752778 [Rhagoletis pomonella]